MTSHRPDIAEALSREAGLRSTHEEGAPAGAPKSKSPADVRPSGPAHTGHTARTADGTDTKDTGPTRDAKDPTDTAHTPGPSDAAPAEDHERQLEHDLEELTARAEKADEYLELAKRTRADFDNYRKRAARETAAAQDRGIAKLAKELLPAVDNLDRALEAAEATVRSDATGTGTGTGTGTAPGAGPRTGLGAGALGDPAGPRAGTAAKPDNGTATLVSGIKLVHDEVISALARAGIERFSPEGERFDPQQHEAIAQQPVEGKESGTVVEVYQRGYRLGDVVIRPARVVVAA